MKLPFLSVAFIIVASTIAANLPSPHAAQPAAQDETAAVQSTLDELKRTTVAMAAALEKLESRRPANPATKSLAELGCKPNDSAFDNAPLIQPALDAGYNLDVDGLYYTSPLKTPVGVFAADGKTIYGRSCIIAGQGAGYRHGGKGVTGFVAFRADQPCLIECPGTASPGQVQVIRDLYLLGNDKCDGIRVHGCRVLNIEGCVPRNCAKGVVIAPTTGCYAANVRGCSILACGIGIDVANAATVCSMEVSATEIMGGKIGLNVNGWKRGMVLTAVACENQTVTAMNFVDARATLIGCYLECPPNPGFIAKDSKLTIIDTSAGAYKASLNSQITWLGDNMQAGTLGF